MKRIVVLLCGFVAAFILAACRDSSSTPQVVVTHPSVAPTTIPGFTVNPLTPTAIAQFFKTLEAVSTPMPEATTTPNYRDCAGNLFFKSLGKWGLCSGLKDPIMIISQSNQIWQFSYKEYYGRNVPNPCTRLLHLTNDERFLYFSLDEECELIEPGFITSIAVFRMDLSNGEVREILTADYDFESYNGYSYTVSISPTGRRLAYIFEKDQPLRLHLLDLQTGEEDSFILDDKYTFGGRYHWSTDGTKLAFMLESTANHDRFISMVYLDMLKDNSMVTFMDGKEYHWIQATLEVSEVGVKISVPGEGPLFYDVNTGIISESTK